MFFFKIFLIFTGLMMLFLLLTQKYVNPYKLIMIFGKKGSGKSTTLTKLALKHLKKGWTVYSTEEIPGTYLVCPGQIGFIDLPDFNFVPFDPDAYRGLWKLLRCFFNRLFPHRPKSVLLVDEVGMIWDNRDFKNFKPQVRNWFKLQRHRHCKVYLFSQTFDIDKKLRDLTDAMYLQKNVLRVFTYGKKIRKYITIKESMQDNASTLSEGMEFEPFIFFFMGSRTLTFIPKWSRYFNSFEADPLPVPEFGYTDFGKGMEKLRYYHAPPAEEDCPLPDGVSADEKFLP